MSLTSLPLLKSQLNLDHDLDDALLQHKLDAAELWIENYIGSLFVADNPALTEAALQLASYWYEVREAGQDTTIRAVPFGARELLNSYKNQVTGHVPE